MNGKTSQPTTYNPLKPVVVVREGHENILLKVLIISLEFPEDLFRYSSQNFNPPDDHQ